MYGYSRKYIGLLTRIEEEKKTDDAPTSARGVAKQASKDDDQSTKSQTTKEEAVEEEIPKTASSSISSSEADDEKPEAEEMAQKGDEKEKVAATSATEASKQKSLQDSTDNATPSAAAASTTVIQEADKAGGPQEGSKPTPPPEGDPWLMENTLDRIPTLPHETRRGRHHDDDASSVTTKTSVSFGQVQVREYERVIDTSMYMGLSLGWAYNDTPAHAIETQLSGDGSVASAGSSSQTDEVRSRKKKPPERFSTFLSYGYTRKQLKQATAEAAKLMKKRERDEARRLGQGDNATAANAPAAAAAKPKRSMWLRSSFSR